MKRVLLYSPDVIGHPRVYCRVIADALAQSPCELVVAMGFSEGAGLAESPDLHPLVSRPRVQLVDTREFSRTGQPHLVAEELVAMQAHLRIDTTLFIEADKSNAQFTRIAAGEAPRLLGRNLGIFANTAEWYPGEDSFTGERKRLRASSVRTTLGNIKRALFNRRGTARHFYEHTIIGSSVLDEVLVKDERLARWRRAPVFWMPEISRPASAPETENEEVEYLLRERELHGFLAQNAKREPVLYFGDAASYKGYDLFMQFIANTPRACAIHAGRALTDFERTKLTCDVDALRAQLLRENRLLETNGYVHTQRLKELYFGAVRVYLTTHRLALSSSTMIQALELGQPVLVPDRGLLAHRVREHGLGRVYAYGDLNSLRREAEAIWDTDLTAYRTNALRFWKEFSDESIQKFFIDRLLAK